MNDILNLKQKIVEVRPEIHIGINAMGQIEVKGTMPPLKCLLMLMEASTIVAKSIDEAMEAKKPLVEVAGANAIPKN